MRKSNRALPYVITFAAFGALLAFFSPANAQDPRSPLEVFLPWPSTMGQPVPTPLHRTTWKVLSVTDQGKTMKPKQPYGFLFDFSHGVGMHNVLSFDGCEAKNGSFELKNNRLTVGNRYGSGGGCASAPASEVMDKILSGTVTITPAKSAIWFRGITLRNGRRSARLEPLIRSDLVGTAWVLETALDPKPSSTPVISFDATKFAGGDGCNTFDGGYLALSNQITVAEVSQTAAYCEAYSAWEVKPNLVGSVSFLIDPSGETLSLFKQGTTLQYRRAKAMVRPPI